MSKYTVLEVDGQRLQYDMSDVESIEFSTPRDVHDVTEEGGPIMRKLGKHHLNLTIHFKEGSDGARWV